VIAAKTGLTMQYVQGILTLLDQGEERLLIAVEKGHIPLNAALTIVGVGDDDKAMQSAMQDAYESGELRGKQLMDVRRIIEKRKVLGRSVSKSLPRKQAEPSASSLVRTYRREVERQKLMVKKAAFVEQCLLFVIEAMRQLLADENFVNLLRAEGLDTLPKYLSEQVWSKGSMT
jgi:ParB family chromosome partitioning protein